MSVTSVVALWALAPAVLAAGLLIPTSAVADDSSAVTVTAAQQDPDVADAPFPNLSVTVSQTTDLVNQGIRLTYSGGTQSNVPNTQVAGSDFLQVMQCWGDLKDSSGDLVLDDSGNPQPDRTTCQYGSGQALGYPGQSRTSTKASLDDVSPQDDAYLYKGSASWDPPQVSIPFRSVTGKTLQTISDGAIVSTDDIDQNEFFTKNTTNEVPWAGFGASGSGSVTFEVQTNGQAPGLGCGNPITGSDGTVTGRSCWLVIVPRGDHDLGEQHVTKSGLLWETWKHHLAVRLQFKPLGVRCAIGAAEQALGGSELMTAAVASWQPKLCGTTGGSIYNLIVANEQDELVAANGTTKAPLALTTRALSSDEGTDNLTYAPVAVTGLTISFAIDHRSNSLVSVPADVAALDQQPFTQLNLTPRLVAKLLTDSYQQALPTYASTLGGATYIKDNPQNLTQDPDFLAVNDAVWKNELLYAPSIADAFVTLGQSDAAWAVWSYILADADAVEFLAGKSDPWGMTVNPYFSTSDTVNPTGTGASYPVATFPKADPVSVDFIKDASGRSAINEVTWRPYATDLDTSAYWVLRGDGRVLGNWSATASPPKFDLADRALPGSQAVIGVTDTASAAKYQVYTAALRNSAGQFVTPTSGSMAAAAMVMTPVSGQPQVRALDYTSTTVKSASSAYPLTVPVYAATNVAGGDTTTRAAYSAFINYAAGSGQTPGIDEGELPAGYAPLPQSWAAAAARAAASIAAGPAPATSVTTAATNDVTQTSTSARDSGQAPAAAASTSEVLAGAGTATSTAGSPTPTISPTGTAAASLSGSPTAADPGVGALRAAVPATAGAGLLAAFGTPLVGRLRRRPE